MVGRLALFDSAPGYLAPSKAVVLRGGEPVEVLTADVVVGDLLLVRPGAKIAVDGIVEEGESDINESMVTGESLPLHKTVGAAVIGATLNANGTLRVRATEVGADTELAQIVALVRQAQNSKAPGQRLADRAAFWLVFVALIAGTDVAIDAAGVVLMRHRRRQRPSPQAPAPAHTPSSDNHLRGSADRPTRRSVNP